MKDSTFKIQHSTIKIIKMGKPTGFIEFTRELPGKRAAAAHVN